MKLLLTTCTVSTFAALSTLLAFADAKKATLRNLQMGDMKDYQRHLQAYTEDDRPCNAPFTIIRIQEIKSMVDLWIGDTFDVVSPAEYDTLMDIYTSSMKYPVLASRVCGSCATTTTTVPSSSLEQTEQWHSYCGNQTYGYDAIHSSLVFHPILDDNHTKPVRGRLNGLVQMQSLRLEGQRYAPSLSFPTNHTQTLQQAAQDDMELRYTYLDAGVALIAASSGMIAVSPDGLGIGASVDDHDRSFLTKLPVQQATAVSYLAAQAYTREISNGCTELSDKTLVQGYSLGGANAAHAAATLDDLGLVIEQAFVHAAPTDLPLLLFGGLSQLLFSNEPKLPNATASFLALVAAAYSNDMPFLANTGTDQILLSNLYLDESNRTMNVLEWFFGTPPFTEPEIYAALPDESLAMINPDIVQAFQTSNAGLFFCMNPPIEVKDLCQTLVDNSATQVLDSATFSIQSCHSPNDEIIPFTLNQFGVPTRPGVISSYQPPISRLVPSGNHLTSYYQCNSAVPVFLANSDINEIGPLLGGNGTCVVEDDDDIVEEETSAPTVSSPMNTTTAPTMAPVTNGTATVNATTSAPTTMVPTNSTVSNTTTSAPTASATALPSTASPTMETTTQAIPDTEAPTPEPTPSPMVAASGSWTPVVSLPCVVGAASSLLLWVVPF